MLKSWYFFGHRPQTDATHAFGQLRLAIATEVFAAACLLFILSAVARHLSSILVNRYNLIPRMNKPGALLRFSRPPLDDRDVVRNPLNMNK